MDTDLPLVSIVTPSFAQAPFLRRTVDSVLSQDYPRIEYLVVDGGSRDGSVDILRSYGDRLAWVSEPDRGQSHAVNKGLARARGDILAYLNSDDVLLPGAVRAVVEHFRRRPEWDLVYGRAYHIDEADRILEAYPTREYSFEALRHHCFICQPAAFWRRSLAQRVGPFDENLHFALDLDWWMRADRAGGVLRHVPEFLAGSRLYPANKTMSRRGEVYREIFEVSRRHAGEAGFSHFLAWWTHQCRERRGGWTRGIGRLPGAAHWLAVLHQRWHRHGGSPWRMLGDLFATLGRKMGRCLRRPKAERDQSLSSCEAISLAARSASSAGTCTLMSMPGKPAVSA